MNKYSILEKLKLLPYKDYIYAKKYLPYFLDISPKTFNSWLYIKIDSKRQIPLDKIAAISFFLKVKIEDLMNEEIAFVDMELIKKKKVSEVKKQFKLK